MNKMKFEFNQLKTKKGIEINGPILLKPKVLKDERGFFYESWNEHSWEGILKTYNQTYKSFVQDNHSKSIKGVLRGLHFQKDPFPQGKLIRCIIGEIFDVAVDIRKNSSTFGDWIGTRLSSTNKNQFWIPEGFAHGFLTLTDIAEVNYKTTNLWNKNCEECLLWEDKSIGIDWPIHEYNIENLLISSKDKEGKPLKDFY
tara:strand:- start:110 stop:706 length:597 start_codon:yes stop_codon:yes gene_type:complete